MDKSTYITAGTLSHSAVHVDLRLSRFHYQARVFLWAVDSISGWRRFPPCLNIQPHKFFFPIRSTLLPQSDFPFTQSISVSAVDGFSNNKKFSFLRQVSFTSALDRFPFPSSNGLSAHSITGDLSPLESRFSWAKKLIRAAGSLFNVQSTTYFPVHFPCSIRVRGSLS